MIVLFEYAIQQILPRTPDYYKITFRTHPRSVVTMRVTNLNVQILCIFLHNVGKVSCRSHNKYHSTKQH